MKSMLGNTEEILNFNISGFHQYVLTEPVHLSFVSRNLCEMLCIAQEELLSEDKDLYLPFVHPADRESYSEFLHRLKSEEQELTAEYRIIKKDGSVIYVKDTMTSKRLDGGIMAGYSVLTDITKLKTENNDLRFLNDTIPCGFLKYTCEKQPRVTYINDRMLKILRFPEIKDGETDYLELCKENIFLMIPMEERRRFTLYLNRVYTAGVPMAGEIPVLRCDGTRAYIFGWVTKCVNEQGVEEFQSVCMDITQRHHVKKANETKRYIKALSDVYDKIFEYDFANNTVKCLYAQDYSMFRWIENIPMQMEEATEKWIAGNVVEEERERVSSFFRAFCQKSLKLTSSMPPQIEYRARSSKGDIKLYRGIFLKMDDNISLYCCRNVLDLEEADFLRNENISLKENMHELVMRFKDGIAAFEVINEQVTPLYASDNVCEFFGYTKEEWLRLMKVSTPMKSFVSHSKFAYEDFVELLQNGEAEYTYFDLNTQTERRIKAICSSKSPGGSSPRYVMLYNVDDTPLEIQPSRERRVSIRTFGYFDVFVNGKPIAFRNKKSKELFALLTDRRGGFITSEEAIGFLWEDEPVSPVTLARYRKVALRLKNILEEYGISDVVESVDGKRRIVPEKVQCDLYDYLSGKEEYAQLFKGSYLTNYSWSENTLAELTGKIIY